MSEDSFRKPNQEQQPGGGLASSRRKIIRRIFHWILAVYLVVYVITGLGITNYQEVEPLTLGLLGKALSMKIHDNIHWPFIALIVLHTYLSLISRKQKED